MGKVDKVGLADTLPCPLHGHGSMLGEVAYITSCNCVVMISQEDSRRSELSESFNYFVWLWSISDNVPEADELVIRWQILDNHLECVEVGMDIGYDRDPQRSRLSCAGSGIWRNWYVSLEFQVYLVEIREVFSAVRTKLEFSINLLPTLWAFDLQSIPAKRAEREVG